LCVIIIVIVALISVRVDVLWGDW